jgi:hypothetical protein
MDEVIQQCFLPLRLLDTDKKHYSRCPDALAVCCCNGEYRLSLLVHFWYSPCYPMESVCSKMDKQTSGANADIVERAKSLFSETLLRLNDIDGPYFYDVTGTNNLPGSLSFLLCITEDVGPLYVSHESQDLFRFHN